MGPFLFILLKLPQAFFQAQGEFRQEVDRAGALGQDDLMGVRTGEQWEMVI